MLQLLVIHLHATQKSIQWVLESIARVEAMLIGIHVPARFATET